MDQKRGTVCTMLTQAWTLPPLRDGKNKCGLLGAGACRVKLDSAHYILSADQSMVVLTTILDFHPEARTE